MKNSSIYFLNIFLKIYLAIINICLVNNLRFNMYFEYNPNNNYTHFFVSKKPKKLYNPLKIIQKKHPI
ncbi:hypothetical protein CN504_27505 [Bacillus anthracis]|nr:hypothetical protein CN504_27505 [Bacillus anthracis]